MHQARVVGARRPLFLLTRLTPPPPFHSPPGHPTYLVGGAVRDTLLGRRPKDFDILTTAPPAVLTRLFSRARVVGARYPITHILAGASVHEVSTLLPVVAEARGGGGRAAAAQAAAAAGALPPPSAPLPNARATKRRAAVATLNSGAWPADPVSREVALEAALAASAESRDFTVNALFLDPRTGRLADPTGRGVADLAARRLTCVSADPVASFTDDPARMLRAIRLASRTGLRLSPADVAALTRCAGKVATLPAGRLALELSALVAHGSAARAVALAREWGMLVHLLPAHAALLDRECGPVTVAASQAEMEAGEEEEDEEEDATGGGGPAYPAPPPPSLTRPRTPARVEGMAALVGLDSCTLPDRPAPPGVVAAALIMPLLSDEVRRWRPGAGGGEGEGGGESDEGGGAPYSASSAPAPPPLDPADAAFARLVNRAVAALSTPVPCCDNGSRLQACLISRAAAVAGGRMIRKAAAPAPDRTFGALPLSIVAGSVNSGGAALPDLPADGRSGAGRRVRAALSQQSSLARNQNVFLIGRRLAVQVREAAMEGW